MEGGDLEFLVKNNFTKLPLQQQLKIISDGRPTPKLELRMERKKGGIQTFNEENYVRKEWLAGSAELQRLFYWPCLLFYKDSCSLNNPWATTGFMDLANLSRAIERHGKSKSHIDCAVKLKLFGRQDWRGSGLGENHQHKEAQWTGEEEPGYSDETHCCSLVPCAPRTSIQDNEAAGSSNGGNFVELVHTFAEFDTTLSEHLGSPSSSNRVSEMHTPFSLYGFTVDWTAHVAMCAVFDVVILLNVPCLPGFSWMC